MGGVNFDDAEARPASAFGGGNKCLLDRFDFVSPKFFGRRIVVSERYGAWRDRLPSAFRCWDHAVSGPRPIGAALASRMGELNTGDSTLVLDESRDFLERLEMSLAPNA